MKHATKKLAFLFLILFGFGLFNACDEDDDASVESEITLENPFLQLTVGTDVTLTPRFVGAEVPNKDYVWTVSDESVLSVVMNEDRFTATVTAIGEGQADAIITSTDGALQASTTISTVLIRETEATLPPDMTVFTQTEVTITPDFNNVDIPVREYTYTVEPAGMIDFTVNPETQAITMQGVQEGVATLTLSSSDGVVNASSQLDIVDENDGILKILAIGNSFSEDALETYLWEIADAAGKEIVIGNMFIGAADLETHANNAESDAASYSYRKVSLNGEHTTNGGTSLSEAIADENWDYISFQQASYFSGLFDTYTNTLPRLFDKVQDYNTNEFTKYVFHRTWAYAKNSTHSGFPNYDSDQDIMFNAIVDAYNQAENLIPVTFTTPAGTAIQNGRTSYLGDGFTRDGFHLNDLGKYTAGLTWFEMLFEESAIGNSFVPDGLIEFDIEMAQNAAHEAVLNPQVVTELVDFQDTGGTGQIVAPVLINFSSSTNPSGWNAFTSHLDGSSVPNLLYQDGTFTGVEAVITERFRGINNTSGEATTNTVLNMPEDVSRSNFYVNGRQWGGNDPIARSVIEFRGFTTTDAYDFCFFGSRSTFTDNRQTVYTLTGATEQSGSLDATQNTSDLVCISGVQPDADGKITLTITMGDDNSSTNGFYYLNAMRIQPN